MAIVDVELRLRRMDLRHGDVARGRVRAHDLRAQPRHRLAEQTAPAADVEQPQPLERPRRLGIAPELGGDLLDHVAQPAGLEHVQRLELALRIPPLGGHGLELGDLGRIYGSG